LIHAGRIAATAWAFLDNAGDRAKVFQENPSALLAIAGLLPKKASPIFEDFDNSPVMVNRVQ